MTCTALRLAGRGVAIVCTRSKPARCSHCRMAPATQLCDGPGASGRTCDAPLCIWCSKREGSEDYCPQCAQARIFAEVRRWPADLAEDFDERAALIEDGCKVSRAAAERMAFDLLKKEAPPKDQLHLTLKG